jgi:hypothetical protein
MKQTSIICFLLIISFVVFSQPNFDNTKSLSGTTWKIDKFIADKVNSFKLFPKNEKEIYGFYIQFTDSVHFKSYNQISCGMDCKKTAHGSYQLTIDGKLKLVISKITNSPFCPDTSSKNVNKPIGLFTIKQNGDSIILQKAMAYDLSTPIKSLQTLATVLQMQDTVELKKVVSANGYAILMKEIGLKRFKSNGDSWLAAIKAKHVSIKYASKETEKESAYTILEVISKGNEKFSWIADMSFEKEKGSKEWKFILFARDE